MKYQKPISKKVKVTNKFGEKTYVWFAEKIDRVGSFVLCSSKDPDDEYPYVSVLIQKDGSISIFRSGELTINEGSY